MFRSQVRKQNYETHHDFLCDFLAILSILNSNGCDTWIEVSDVFLNDGELTSAPFHSFQRCSWNMSSFWHVGQFVCVMRYCSVLPVLCQRC